MRSASEQLVQTTWMCDDPLFKNHDAVTPVNWEKVWASYSDTAMELYGHNHLVLIAVLEFLCGSEMVEVGLDEIASLEEHERTAVLEALRVKWGNVQIQENL